MNKKGFTLIELLVVVLIIGILAAIAVPQYQKAVDKTEFSKYQSMVASLIDAYDEYVLINGKGTKNFEDLSFTIPHSFTKVDMNNNYAECVANGSMWCCMRDYVYVGTTSYWEAQIYCGKQDTEQSIVYLEYLYDPQGNKKNRQGICIAKADNNRANNLCSSLGTPTTYYALVTPNGIANNGYNAYGM